jgi:transcriptional regulator GlxA family with amidase domain
LKAASRRSVEQLARWSGITRQTLARRLRDAGWPSPHTIMQSFRALDAIWLMAECGWSARRVQEVRLFANASAVGRLTRRYTGMAPRAIREEGGFSAALETVERALCVQIVRMRDTEICRR